MELCKGVRSHEKKGKKGWWREMGGVSEELSKLLCDAEGLAEVDGGPVWCWRPPLPLGGGLEGLGLMNPL